MKKNSAKMLQNKNYSYLCGVETIKKDKVMLTEKQREAISAMLELYKGGSITSETAMTVIEAVFEGSATIQYIPYTLPSESPYKWPDITPNPMQPIVTYCASNTDGGQTDGR